MSWEDDEMAHHAALRKAAMDNNVTIMVQLQKGSGDMDKEDLEQMASGYDEMKTRYAKLLSLVVEIATEKVYRSGGPSAKTRCQNLLEELQVKVYD